METCPELSGDANIKYKGADGEMWSMSIELGSIKNKVDDEVKSEEK